MNKGLIGIFLPILVLFTLSGCAFHTTPSVPISNVIPVEKVSQNELFIKANSWMVETFNNSKSVIQFTDKESGTVMGRYLLGTVTQANQYGPARYAHAIIKIQVKDNTTKITITPESFQYAVGNPYTLYTQETAESDINRLMISYETFMKTKSTDNW